MIFASSWLEVSAALLAVLYLLLAVRQNIACWLAAFISSCLYVRVFHDARLYMDAALQVFYAAMALYGFVQWRPQAGRALTVSHWAPRRQLLALLVILLAAALSALLLQRFTHAAWPFVDSVLTFSSVFATWLVARKVYENWHWWFVIDLLSALLYTVRHLWLTALLFASYLVLIVFGMRAWRREWLAPVHAAV